MPPSDMKRLFDEAERRAKAELGVLNADGQWWHEAPKPWRFHRCYVHTTAVMDNVRIDRCPCGGIRLQGGRWMERNSRKRA